jgi:hypothetical protein
MLSPLPSLLLSFAWQSSLLHPLLLAGTRHRPLERSGGECDGPEVCFSGGRGDGDQGWQSV